MSLKTKVTVLASEPATLSTCESSSPDLATSTKSKFNTQSAKHAKLINTTKEEIKLVPQQDHRQTTNVEFTTSDVHAHVEGDDEKLAQKEKRLLGQSFGNLSGFDVRASLDTARSNESSSSDTDEELTMSAIQGSERPRVAGFVAI